jgi:hypothetical protein
MATTKRINGDYTIKSVNLNTDTFSIERFGQVTINGNLTVTGNTTTVNSTDTSVRDNIILLNDGETGNGVSRSFAGVRVSRGLLANVEIGYNEDFDKWVLTNNGTTYGNIATFGTTPFITNVSEDLSPSLGGNLDVAGYTIFNSVANLNVIVDAGIQMINRGTDLVAETGNVVMYANTVSGGGSGVYVSNDQGAGQELVTKRKAIVYSLIF